MPEVVTVETRIRTFTVPVPPVDLETTRINLPSFGPFRFPNIRLRARRFDLPTISIPETTLFIPTVDVRQDLLDLGSTQSFFLPTDVDADLFVNRTFFSFLGGRVTFTVPTSISLSGPFIDYDEFGPFDLGSIFIPEIDVGTRTETIGGQVFRLPDIETPSLNVDLPSIPELTLPDLDVPTGAALVGEVVVPDPTGIDVDVSLNLDEIRSFALQPIPDGLITDAEAYVLSAAVSEFRDQLGDGIISTFKTVTNEILDVVLTDETQERLQDQARDKDP